MIEWHLLVRGLLQNIAAFREGSTPPACQSGCRANPLHRHALTHKRAISDSLLQCFFHRISPVGMDTYAHHNIHSCIDNARKQALIKFSQCVQYFALSVEDPVSVCFVRRIVLPKHGGKLTLTLFNVCSL